MPIAIATARGQTTPITTTLTRLSRWQANPTMSRSGMPMSISTGNWSTPTRM